MAPHFQPPEYWTLREIRSEFKKISSPKDQLLYLLEVENSIDDIMEDIDIVMREPSNPDQLLFEEIPDILAFCRLKKELARVTMESSSHRQTSENELLQHAQRLQRKGGRIPWLGAKSQLVRFFGALGDYRLIPEDQASPQFAELHFWTMEEIDAAIPFNMDLARDQQIQWLGSTMELVELFVKLDEICMNVDWEKSSSITNHFVQVRAGAIKPISHSTVKVYRSKFKQNEAREMGSPILELVEAFTGNPLRY